MELHSFGSIEPLAASESGNRPTRSHELIGSLYQELRMSARGIMRRAGFRERLLDPTGLVNEAVLRLLGSSRVRGHADPRYVFGAGLRAMRQVMVERFRQSKQWKRGGRWFRLPSDAILEHCEARRVDFVEIHDALERLSTFADRQAQMFTMRFLLGMSVIEIANHFDVSPSTVGSDLALARAWLRRELADSEKAS